MGDYIITEGAFLQLPATVNGLLTFLPPLTPVKIPCKGKATVANKKVCLTSAPDSMTIKSAGFKTATGAGGTCKIEFKLVNPVLTVKSPELVVTEAATWTFIVTAIKQANLPNGSPDPSVLPNVPIPGIVKVQGNTNKTVTAS